MQPKRTVGVSVRNPLLPATHFVRQPFLAQTGLVKPFLLLATRAEDAAAEDEYQAYLRYCGLKPEELVRWRLESEPLPPLELSDYSGVIVGGSPYTSSDPMEEKDAAQIRWRRNSQRSWIGSWPRTSRSSAPATGSAPWVCTRAPSSIAVSANQ